MEKGSKKGSVGTCNAYVGGPGAAARGRTHFYSRILIEKKGATHNDNAARSPRGARGEPASITLLDPMPPGMLKKECIEQSTADGTRDHDRI